MNKFARFIVIVPVLLGLAACQQQPASPGAATDTQTTGDKLIVTVPAELSACTPAEVIVQWDAQSMHAKTVEIWVGAESNSKLFAAGGMKGEAKTGPWVSPGTRFELKDKVTGKVIGQTTVGGAKCP
jgi:hypothetical protein